MEEKLSTITKSDYENIVKRSTDDILEEILKNSREQMRREDIRLNAFQSRDEKIDTLIKMLEGWMKPLLQSSFFMDSLKEKLIKLIENKDLFLKEDHADPTKMGVALNENRINELFEAAGKIPSADAMAEMMQKLKEISVDSKEETTLLLNPERSDKK